MNNKSSHSNFRRGMNDYNDGQNVTHHLGNDDYKDGANLHEQKSEEFDGKEAAGNNMLDDRDDEELEDEEPTKH
jgi:hypothetical protein